MVAGGPSGEETPPHCTARVAQLLILLSYTARGYSLAC